MAMDLVWLGESDGGCLIFGVSVGIPNESP